MTHTDIKEKVLKGGKLSIERLLAKKLKDNSYIVVSENGKVVRIHVKDLKG